MSILFLGNTGVGWHIVKWLREQNEQIVGLVIHPPEKQKSGNEIVNPRIYRVYGCGPRDVISRWIRTALSGQRIDLYNKHNRFDYIFAGDVAEGLVDLGESPEASAVVNLGTGVAHSVQDVVSILADHFPGLEIGDVGTREASEASCADVTRLRQFTHWQLTTDLNQGIRLIIEYEKETGSRGWRRVWSL